ncbi:hypothetical protein [Neosynechococcus sphagnicola]|nr:hypothetical protein [Neosynechococcus sphagnicola]
MNSLPEDGRVGTDANPTKGEDDFKALQEQGEKYYLLGVAC